MSFKYSPAQGAFFHVDIHDTFPEDAVDVSPEEHTELMRMQSTGHEITPCPTTGRPLATRPTLAPVDPKSPAALARRQAELIMHQHTLIRELVLMPDAGAARLQLSALDKEMREINAALK